MPQTSKYVIAPYNGVSQAPEQVRLPSHAQALEDSFATIPEGWRKRPPVDFLGTLQGTVQEEYHRSVWQELSTSAGNHSLLIYFDDDDEVEVRVFNRETMVEETVNLSADAKVYLETLTTDALTDLHAFTVADTTFIANRKRSVANIGTTAAARPFEALVWVQRVGAFSATYTLRIEHDGETFEAKWLLPDGSTAAHNDDVVTDAVATAIFTGVGGGAYTYTSTTAETNLEDDLIAAGFTIEYLGSVVVFSHPNEDFTMFLEDGQGGTNFVGVKAQVQNFSDLPKRATPDFTVRISQSVTNGELDDYFVKYVADTVITNGYWQETIEPAAALGVNPETLPVTLIFDPGGPDWNVEIGDWKPRTVGNAELIPDPAFIGKTIVDMSFWRGRFVLVYGENVTCADATDAFNLYRTSLATLLDSDPFDLDSPLEKSSPFRFATVFEKRLFIQADQGQIEVVTPDNTAVTPTSTQPLAIGAYETDPLLRPAYINSRLYFGAARGRGSNTKRIVWEMSVNQTTDTKTADDLTVHVPRYIPAAATIRADAPVEYLTAYGEPASDDIYIHLFRYAEDQRQQNAFFRWHLPLGWMLKGMYFRGSALYILACEEVDGEFFDHAGVLDISAGQLDPDDDATILTHLDWRIHSDDLTVTFDPVQNWTSVVMPYASDTLSNAVSTAPGGEAGLEFGGELPECPEGTLADVQSRDGAALYLVGDWTQCPFFAGLSYTGEWTMSRIYNRDSEGNVDRGGLYNIQHLTYDIDQTGYMKVDVSIRGQATRTYSFEGYVFGDPQSQLDQAPDATTEFRVPVMSNTEHVVLRVYNDGHFGSRVVGAEPLGKYSPRAMRG